MEGEKVTIKQIAEELGLDKQKVYRKAKKHFKALQRIDGNDTIVLTKAEADELKDILLSDSSVKSHQEAHQEVLQKALQSTSFDAVLKQLEFANTQLEEKDRQIEQLQKLLDQSQQLQLAEKQEILALQDTIKQEKAAKAAEESTPNEKKSFFQRLFG